MDQFYTKDEIAVRCYNILFDKIKSFDKFDILLEPSAGNGSFFKLLDNKKREGIDIEPKFDGIKKMNFFDYIPDKKKIYLVIGNPPFGRISSQAINFFNKSAEFADIIAFIIPRTFNRTSVQNKLNLYFQLIYSENLPLKPCCFSPPINAKCCFQIWKKTDKKRKKMIYEKTHKDFSFLKFGPNDENNQPTPPLNADFVMKAYGSNCGKIVTNNLKNLRPKSWHWIKSNINIDTLKERFESLDYSMSQDTVRQDSIGQQEVIFLYKEKYG